MKYRLTILIFLVAISVFAFQKEIFAEQNGIDRKQIYELSKECGQNAFIFSQRVRLCDGKVTYNNHYNLKLNKCFIYMSSSCEGNKSKNDQFYSESLIDVNENKDYGTYIGTGKIIDDKPAMCNVSGKPCKSLLEFQNLIQPFMTE